MNLTDEYRKIVLNNPCCIWSEKKENSYLAFKSIRLLADEPDKNLRRAITEVYVLDHCSIAVNDRELLVGRFGAFEPPADYDEVIALRKDNPHYVPSNTTGHRVFDYDKVLTVGVKGILAQVDARLETETDPQKRNMLTAGRAVMEALCRLAKRYEAHLTALSETEQDERRKAELARMAQNFSKMPYEPCTGFYEALQCVQFIQYAANLIGEQTLGGRPDQYLYPYYKKDIESGALTKEFALTLIEQWYYKHNELFGAWPASLMIGGTDRQGNPVFNDITELCVEAIRTTKLVNPAVGVAYRKEMPDTFLDSCIRCIAEGYTRPSIFNDRVVSEGLQRFGISLEDSRYYIHSTCVEITPIATSHIRVAAPYINLMRTFDYILNRENSKCVFGNLHMIFRYQDALHEEVHLMEQVDFSVEELSSFERFWDLTKKVLAQLLASYADSACRAYAFKAQTQASPFCSMLVNDCIERGLDSGDGGAKYSHIFPCIIGFSNFVDSVVAIKKAVYEDKIVTLEELGRQCAENFPDKRLQSYLQNIPPKFGNGIEESDAFGAELFEFIRAELTKHKNIHGAPVSPGYFAWVMHGKSGAITRATPDGREAHSALSEHLGAVRGMDKNGPLGVIDSIAKLDQRCAIGGVATNFRFAKDFISSREGSSAVRDLIRYFMQKECFEMQFNAVDTADLKDAQAHPENYQTLMVRVAGYSDYFVNLDTQIQDEIIQRTEHGSI